MARQKFQSEELVHVLPEYSAASTDIVVMFADRRNLAPKTRAFIDFLVRKFRHGFDEAIAGEATARPDKKAS